MKPKLVILALIFLGSCSNQLNDKVLVFDLQAKNSVVDIHKNKPALFFSRQFLNYLIEKFPYASRAIFFTNNLSTAGIKLTDTTYSFGIITMENRIYLENALPKNLSKEESNSYWKRFGFFTYIDSADMVRQDSIFDERTKWSKATIQMEKEYEEFYNLIKNFDKEYIIVAPKEFIEMAPW